MDDLVWSDVRIFVAAREAGSFSAAAAALGVRQSTVSRRVASLEEALGGALFHRSASGLVPTELGEAIAVSAERMRDGARGVLQAAAGSEQTARGLVRLAVTEGLATYGVAPRLRALRQAHPGLRLELVLSSATADLTRREADLALRFVRPSGGDLVAKRLAAFPLGVLVHPDLADVPWASLPWVRFGDPEVRTPLDGWHDAHTPAPVLRANGYAAVVSAVQHGVGAALLTASIARAVPGLVVRDSPVPLPPPLPLWLVAHREARPLRRVDVVWRALTEIAHALSADDLDPSG